MSGLKQKTVQRQRGGAGAARHPGPEIKAILRREVNFGCPVRNLDGSGCGCPILAYHHFDPRWAEGHQHDPAGMIALCPTHHGLADGERWTKHELRDFKANPFVDTRVKWPWPSTEKLLVRAGPGLVVGEGSPLWLYGKPILGFHRHHVPDLEGNVLIFDSYIEDRAGAPWMKIEDGWFDLDAGSTNDLIFPPQARTLNARHVDGTNLNVQYQKEAVRDFPSWWDNFDINRRFGPVEEFLSRNDVVDSDSCVPIMTVTGEFSTNHVSVNITEREMTVQLLLPGWTGPNGLMSLHGHIVNSTCHMSLVDETKTEFVRFG